MKANYYLYPSRKIYSRKQYTVIDALGQLGGLMSVLMATCRAFMFPISRHMYYWNAIKRLFLARTSDDTLFLKEKKGRQRSGSEKMITKYFNPENYGIQNKLVCQVKKEIKKHKLIRISIFDSFLLFLHDKLICLNRCSCWKRKKPL